MLPRASLLSARHATALPAIARATSTWASVPAGPPDPILGVTENFKADKSPKKINLGVGKSPSTRIRDGNGKPYVLPTGLADFTKLAAELAYGKDSKPIVENRLAITQSISGTGALRIGTAFLARWFPNAKTIYLPTPTWGNHIPISKDSGLEVKQYKYFDKDTVGLDFEGMKADIEKAPDGSVILLHACAHNPTGIDPTEAQWKELSTLLKSKNHFPFFDMAYQGFASGDTLRDAFAVRYFVEQGHQILLCQSFAKNMGLYGERVGAISFVCESEEEKKRVDSQLKIIIRPLYSNPPVHGARLVTTILSDPTLNAEWLTEVKGMADRIIEMRERLYNKLVQLDTPGEWGHIKSQIGMFSFTGLKAEQVDALAQKASIYLTRDGRISMAGLNAGNVDYFAESVSKAVKGTL
ncbi:aspartate aminotransferase, mitochondrial [Cryptococcus wingfieldii CBS 7118]|uniref:Aspartate aminotransferase n=1 Tax=Cryptococcus wingfieldii CBS 7118 TaxID=1295528 RepID=A0A1E3ITW8_9TREE|nr:aspartate aminotransferase, mitochondrial [Cryptococcus wingfieldii CBS 7118]ODN92073.1 aspartate aminotransferase, mitochondrial [Cryptococcus wingfieldii CBS 7118]